MGEEDGGEGRCVEEEGRRVEERKLEPEEEEDVGVVAV